MYVCVCVGGCVGVSVGVCGGGRYRCVLYFMRPRMLCSIKKKSRHVWEGEKGNENNLE